MARFEKIGDFGPGEWKWHSGVRGPDGLVYFMPCHAAQALVLDPTTDAVRPLGTPLRGKFKFNRGVVGADGRIYAMPAHGSAVLAIDPSAQTAAALPLPDSLASERGAKWNHGVLGRDGVVYGIPFDASAILRLHCSRDASDTLRIDSLGEFGDMRFKWRVGLAANNGNIYAVPLNFPKVLVIYADGRAKDASGYGFLDLPGEYPSKDGLMKWNGGVLGSDGRIYCIPANARHVMVIDPDSESTYLLPGDLGTASKKWRNGVSSADGSKIFGMPFDDPSVLLIDLQRQTASRIAFEAGIERTSKWADGALGADGRIYAIPQDADSVLAIDSPSPSSEQEFASASLAGDEDFIGEPVPGKTRSRMCGKWIEAVKSRNGEAIYGVPLHARSILKITVKPRGNAGVRGNADVSRACQGRPEIAGGSLVIPDAGSSPPDSSDGKKRWKRKKKSTS